MQEQEQEAQTKREEQAAIRAKRKEQSPLSTTTAAEKSPDLPSPKKEQWLEKLVIETRLIASDWQAISGVEHAAKLKSAKEKITELAQTGRCGDYRGEITYIKSKLSSTITIGTANIPISNIHHAGIGDEYRIFYTFTKSYLIILQIGGHNFETKRLKMNYEVSE